MFVLAIVLPVFLVVVLGAVLTRARFLSPALITELNRLTYFVGLPAYLFGSIAEAQVRGGRALTIFGVMGGATLATLVAAYLFARVRRVPAKSLGTFLHATIRGNLAYVGLPVVTLAIAAHAGPQIEELRTVALLAMAPMVVLCNGAGVLLLLAGHRHPDTPLGRTILVQLATNPLLLASAAGVAWALLGAPWPGWLARSFGVAGQMALPLALLCIGGTLVVTPLRGKRTASFAAALLKVAMTPVFGYIVGRWAGLTPDELRIALLFLATPTAAASFTLAGKLGGDEGLAASSVVVSTALSILSLSAVLALV